MDNDWQTYKNNENSGVKNVAILLLATLVLSTSASALCSQLTANAGADQIVLPDQWATLDGFSSTGNITAYNWSQVSGPTQGFCGDYNVMISNPLENINSSSIRVLGIKYSPNYQAPRNLTYALTVTDSCGQQDVDYVNVQVDLPENERTFVIYVEGNDNSTALANYYMQARNIPSDQKLGFNYIGGAAIERDPFETQFKPQLEQYIESHNLKDKIKYIVLMYPIAWQIRGSLVNPDGLCAASASFDADLSVIYHFASDPTYNIWPCGAPYPEGRTISTINSDTAIMSEVYGSYESNTTSIPGCENLRAKMYFTSRIDGSSPQVAQREIDDAIYAEQTGTQGGKAYIDAQDATDGMMLNTAPFFQDAGFETIIDENSSIMTSMPDTFYYTGWYSFDYNFPFENSIKRGAIGNHVHSWSTFMNQQTRQPEQHSGGWADFMLDDGFACTFGTMSEPYGSGIVNNVRIYNYIVNKGYSPVEAHYHSVPYLSWMNNIFCDPLYHPPKPSISVCTDGQTQSCGSDSCTGIQTCSNGQWGSCSSVAQDCGTCCTCDSTGTPGFDGTQNSDCVPTTCSSDSCNGVCGKGVLTHFLPQTNPNICRSIGSCTQSSCIPQCENDPICDSTTTTSTTLATTTTSTTIEPTTTSTMLESTTTTEEPTTTTLEVTTTTTSVSTTIESTTTTLDPPAPPSNGGNFNNNRHAIVLKTVDPPSCSNGVCAAGDNTSPDSQQYRTAAMFALGILAWIATKTIVI